MEARFLVSSKTLSPQQFTQLNMADIGFDGLKSGQQFVSDWLKTKQIFSQKTSGSTGTPKNIQIPRTSIIASAERTIAYLNIPEQATALVCLNLAYVGGKMMLARGLSFGWKMTITAANADLVQELSKEVHFDFCAMVPAQVESLVASIEGRSLLERIRCIIIGGAAVSANLQEKLKGLSTQFYSTYGMTETVSHIALRPLNGPNASEQFEVLPGIATRLDERGCLSIKADVTQDQWVVTNDLVEFSSDRHFSFLGRADNVINSGGIKVQIEALEHLILQSTALQDSQFAITSLPDQRLGEQIVLVVVKGAQLTDNKFSQLALLLPKYQAPKRQILVDAIPITYTGKKDRARIKSLVAEIS